MAYEFKLSKLKELINFSEGHLGLDITKMNDHDLETVAYIMYQEYNIMAAIDQPVSEARQKEINELMARAKKEEVK